MFRVGDGMPIRPGGRGDPTVDEWIANQQDRGPDGAAAGSRIVSQLPVPRAGRGVATAPGESRRGWPGRFRRGGGLRGGGWGAGWERARGWGPDFRRRLWGTGHSA